MCSIGWIRLEDRWLLFKNRDRYKIEKLRSNTIEITKDAIMFKDKKMPGAWLGINRWGLGVATGWGPVVASARQRIAENFTAVEKVLKETKTPKQAREMYAQHTTEFGRSYNLIFANARKAYEHEQIRLTTYVGTHEQSICKTNHFEHLKLYNLEGPRFYNSRARLNKFREMVSKVKKTEDVLKILCYKSKDEKVSMIRKGEFETIASVVIEVKGKDVTVYYVLNKAPGVKSYKKKTWRLK